KKKERQMENILHPQKHLVLNHCSQISQDDFLQRLKHIETADLRGESKTAANIRSKEILKEGLCSLIQQ
ncbi:MAG TPA: hypothetical protein VET23_13155, partial [Chitinophagaceae bacterium]|nr:hypothetical protein [Chitinophagaceae bacterium]